MEGSYKEKSRRNLQIINDLQKQISDQQSIVGTNQGDNTQLNKQLEGKESKLNEREAEIQAVREQITQRAARGEDLKRVLDGLIDDNNRLTEQRAKDQDELARAKELRRVRKYEGEEMHERLKRIKGHHFDITEKLKKSKDAVLQKDSELQGLLQELNRVQNKLSIQKE